MQSRLRQCRLLLVENKLCFWMKKIIDLIKGKKVLVIDDVISTGSTLEAMHEILEEAGGDILGKCSSDD